MSEHHDAGWEITPSSRAGQRRPFSLGWPGLLAWLTGLAVGLLLGVVAPPPGPEALAAAPAILSPRADEYPAWVRGVQTSPPPRGARGQGALALQRLLFSLGYDVSLDGIYGAETASAVSRFQAQAGLRATGQADATTVARILATTWWYPVQPGDTLSGIARLYGTTVDTLVRLNGLGGDTIRVGQRLLVPRAGIGGTVVEWGRYRVQPGDTLWSVARRFGISYEALQRINAIMDPRALRPGQLLWLPSRPTVAGSGAGVSFDWPVTGPITSEYGWRANPFGGSAREFHEGLDIAVPSGTPVKAAAPGVVLQAGWMDGFGYGVVIDHGGGVQSLYGHLSRVGVRAGQAVARGEVIAWSGSTGRSTGPHLDFRIKIDGKTVDPLPLLPSR
ncbi:peptidoglycan DD-metalloendopeptidase family protein [Geochorda subterranea]|uniref:Peptidoglycan DD-metalloendopeptidase family protein n=1 Tax=Geochorda subterranea TaxID=3109564 RepID=A0ABZ1BRI2_9FIRM|nr:peptidoglycan DD-metalloendopeptidase family protein [Limnochorda sp. LNt]WRP15293.1 peptidoglycan DD-metalloendopeptidase family protein [Limnochorda sp. LNt]